MARLRSAPSSQQNAPAAKSTRQALREKTNTAGVSTPAQDVFKDFVKDARSTRGRAKKNGHNEDELVMAGGLGQKSDAPRSKAPMTTDELAKSHGHAPPTAKANKRLPRQARKPAQSEAQSKVFEDMKKRMRATAQKEVANDKIVDVPVLSDNAGPSSDALPTKPPPAGAHNAAAAERSEFSLSPSPPPPGKLSAGKNKRSSTARPDSVLKSQSTPTAETSVLALKNFKRRPRQPSMLAMVQQRAASARPSAAHVQATEVEVEDPSVFDVDGGDEDGEEFAPDAEGTPLHLRKAKRASAASAKNTPSASKKKAETRGTVNPRKRKSDNVDSSSSLSALRAKRQKPMSPAKDAPMASGLPQSSERGVSQRREMPRSPTMSEVQVINSSPSTPPTEPEAPAQRQAFTSAGVVVPSTEEQENEAGEQQRQLNDAGDFAEPDGHNDTMADPLSSSPPPEDPVSTQRTDIMAEPLTQVTPPRPKRDKDKAGKKTQPMMTATLQSLLPKRRQPPKPRHRKSEYDIDSDSDEDGNNDGDDTAEEDMEDGRSRRRTKTASAKNRKSTVKSKTPAAARKSAALSQATRKSTAPAARRKTAGASKKPTKTGRTYGRNAASDKENEPGDSDFEELSDNDDSALPDTSLSMHEAAQQSGELAAAKAKFAEVDEWDMEFESVSFEEGRSSSQTWR